MALHALRRLSWILVLLAVAGCGAEQRPRAATAPAREIPADVGSMLAKSRPQYGGAVVTAGADQPALRRAYEDRVPEAVRATIKHDPALDLVAQVLAAIYLRTRQVPAVSLEQWLFWRCGATTIPAGFDILAFYGDDPTPSLDQRLAQVAEQQRTRHVPISYGLVRVAFSDTITVQALVLARRPVEVPAFKKSFEPGQEIEVAVRPTLGYTDLTLFADAGGGDVRVVPMTAGDDQSHWAKVVLPSQPGRYFVEVVGVEPVVGAADPDHPWRNSLLLLPVYVGVPEPTEPDDFIRHPLPNPPDAAAFRDLILRGYNAERARFGRGPLALDPRAVGVAQEHSDEVARTAGDPRPDVHVYEELATAGLPANEVGYSLGNLEFVSEYVHARLLEPAARHRLLSPATTLLGLGLSRRPAEERVRPWAVVEYAIEPVGALDAPKERDRVYAELAALDRAEQRPPIERDDGLGQVAQQVAEEVCRGARKLDDPKGIWDRARGVTKGYTKAGSFSWVGYHFSKAEIARVREGTKGRGYTRIGVGLCQGDLPGQPKGTFVLMMEMGQ
jgi:hypothetical protein